MAGTTLVIGATGRVGSGVVRELAARGAAVRAACRTPGNGQVLWPAGVLPVEFDYDRPETFLRTTRGVERMFLMVRPGDDRSDETAIMLVDAALRNGVTQIVSLTAMGVERLPDNALRRLECHVERTAPAWTHLRPNFFMQIFTAPPLLDQVRADDRLRLPAGAARLSFVDARDIAAAAAAALLDPVHAGCAYTLTGPEAVDHAAVAQAISGVIGRDVRYAAVDEGEARRELAASGLSASRVERLVGFYRLVRAGDCAVVTPDLESILGRRATTVEQFAAAHAAAWSRREMAAVVATGRRR